MGKLVYERGRKLTTLLFLMDLVTAVSSMTYAFIPFLFINFTPN